MTVVEVDDFDGDVSHPGSFSARCGARSNIPPRVSPWQAGAIAENLEYHPQREHMLPRGSAKGMPMGSVLVRVVKRVGVTLAVLIGVLVVGLVVVPPATRWFTDSWGATAEERAASLPGDGLFPATREISTKGITIAAPPQTVYALVQQMGQHRGGWYGWDWFYDATGSSDFVDGHYSTRVVPELQNVKVGDRININDMVAYDVVTADPGKAFVLAAGSLTAEQLDSGSRPATWTENTMAFVLRPTSDGGTRLLLRMRADGTESGFARWMWNGPLNFGGALFSRKTMEGIKRVAESLPK
jgi:hypothetical protein